MSRRIVFTERPTVDKSCGVNTGMGVCSYFAMLFEANEQMVKGRKLTDEQITLRVRNEFPGRKGAFFTGEKRKTGGKETVNQWRQKFNKGNYSRGIPPMLRSFRYNSRGQIVDDRTGKYPLLTEEIDQMKHAHQEARTKALKALKTTKQV